MQAFVGLISSIIVVFKLLSMLTLDLRPVWSLSPPVLCRSLCGGIPINYPFGVDDGCGAPHYRKMLNCSGDLFLLTPSGSYKVRSIDYDKQTMVIFDPAMSTCTTLQPHHDFVMSEIQSVVMPPSSDTVFALLNCSIDSPVLNHYRSLCFNFSGHSCDELYSACTSFRIFQQYHALSPPFTVTPSPFYANANATSPPPPSSVSLSPPPPCCFTGYDTMKLMSMNILDCTHYTTVYNTDSLKGVGPLDWSYGMKLAYSVPNVGCDRCQRSGGTCGFDTETEGMLCICSTSANNTRDCGTAVGGNINAAPNWGSKSTPLTYFQLLICVFGAFINIKL